ncbi:unnamed protein product, partial [marine sediment metagenome]
PPIPVNIEQIPTKIPTEKKTFKRGEAFFIVTTIYSFPSHPFRILFYTPQGL